MPPVVWPPIFVRAFKSGLHYPTIFRPEHGNRLNAQDIGKRSWATCLLAKLPNVQCKPAYRRDCQTDRTTPRNSPTLLSEDQEWPIYPRNRHTEAPKLIERRRDYLTINKDPLTVEMTKRTKRNQYNAVAIVERSRVACLSTWSPHGNTITDGTRTRLPNTQHRPLTDTITKRTTRKHYNALVLFEWKKLKSMDRQNCELEYRKHISITKSELHAVASKTDKD